MSIILMYHRVAAVERDPFDLAVHPDRFAQHVEYLARSNRTVPLEELARGRDNGHIALTFDDGYADNALVAAPQLANAGLPATWFITVGRLGARRFWWDRLSEAFLGTHSLPGALDIHLAGQELWLDLRTRAARTASLHFVRWRLMALAPDQLEAEVDRIVEMLSAPPSTQDDVTMSVDQLRELSALPHQEVGAHTLTHPRLNDQEEETQRREVLGSVQHLSEILQRSVTAFAYPFGNVREDVGSVAPRLVAESGCRLACTTEPGSVRSRGNQYLLPRLFVGNWGEEEFATQLRAALSAR
jgi:peptidoglycan/xylan/chitin deacetylase (PgdA/CDA1 family)